MKKQTNLLKLILLMLLVSPAVLAQDDATTKPAKEFVKSTYENPVLINNQTIETIHKKSLEMMIQHRFGVIESADDLFGIFGPSNIRFGLNYGFTNRLSVGLGATKEKELYSLDVKYAILKQSKKGGSPVSVTYFGSFDRSALPKTSFQVKDDARKDKDTTKYEAMDRFSFFHELMVARKINKEISLQLGFTWSHVNLVDSGMNHDVMGISFAGRYKFSPQSSIILEADMPLTTHDVNKNFPNFGLGYEVATSGHAFQVFICVANNINNAHIMVFNNHDISEKQVLLGFNITRLWGF
jgi:hypothetical protein